MLCASERRASICETSSWACFWWSPEWVEGDDRAEHAEYQDEPADVREDAEAGSGKAVSG